jgi:hypothetical protein
MNRNTISVQINKPISVVFEYTINPKNTPLWIDSVDVEETDNWPIQLGTTYRNKGEQTEWNVYKVSDFVKDSVFELTSTDNKYHVRYVYKFLNEDSTEMTYDEWVDSGELNDPFSEEVLKKLKKVLEEL